MYHEYSALTLKDEQISKLLTSVIDTVNVCCQRSRVDVLDFTVAASAPAPLVNPTSRYCERGKKTQRRLGGGGRSKERLRLVEGLQQQRQNLKTKFTTEGKQRG